MSRRALVALVATTLVAACGTSDAAGPEPSGPATPPSTVGGVGELPDTIPPERSPLVVVTRPVDPDDGQVAELVGDQVEGNRILMVGDSILAATSRRYGNQMCQELEPLGWAVQLEAEPGRFVEFGHRVLDRVLDDVEPEDDWDAAAVFLGSNYRGDPAEYEEELAGMLFRLLPRPTLLYTVTEYRPDYAEVNEVIAGLAEAFDNVTVIDWGTIAETPGVLSGDGLHPTDEGQQVLAELTAAALGPAPDPGAGECLRSSFTDDSAIDDQTGTPPSQGSSGGRGTGSGSSSGSSGSGASSGSSGSGSGGSGSATTAPPSTGEPDGTTPDGTDTDGTSPPTGGPDGTVDPTDPPTPTQPPATDPPAPAPTDPPATPAPTQPPATPAPTQAPAPPPDTSPSQPSQPGAEAGDG